MGEFVVALPGPPPGAAGNAVLMVTISAYGTCLDAEVAFSSVHPPLDQAALDAARNLRYIPAQSRDGPVISVEWLEIAFPPHRSGRAGF